MSSVEDRAEFLRMSEEAERLTEAEAKKSKNRRRGRKAAVISGAALLATFVIGAPFLYSWLGHDGVQSAQSSETSQSSASTVPSTPTGSTGDYGEEWFEKEATRYPVKYVAWEKEAYTPGEAIPDGVLNKFTETALYDDTLPSEYSGYTTDLTKVGDISFTYWSKELFAQQAGNIIEYLLNPDYGHWGGAQKLGQPLVEEQVAWFTTEPMFTKLVSAEDKANYPFLIDWNGDGFGLVDKLAVPKDSTGTWFYGDAENITSSFIYHDDLSNYSATVSFDAVYKAFGVNKEVYTLTRPMTVNFVVNPDTTSEQRVLVDSVSVGTPSLS